MNAAFDEHETIELTEKLLEQTQDKLAGKHIPERIVSLFDPEARPL